MNEPATYSNPEGPVRHSYPVAVNEAGFGVAAKLCLKTSSFILMRLGVLAAFALAALLWLALCGGVAWLFSGRHSQGGGGAVLFLLGVGIPGGLYWWLRKYVLYMLKLGHIAVLTKLITDGALPEGVSQVQYGKQIVTEHFPQTQVFFAVDSLVCGIIAAFNRKLDWLAEKLPIPGSDSAMGVVHRIVDAATTYIDETIFSYNLARGDENVWRSSMDGVVYYAQNAQHVLKTAVTCVFMEYGLTFASFLVLLFPCWLITYPLPDSVGSFGWALAVLLAAGIKDVLLRPVFLTMVALTFHQSVHNQEIDLDCMELLHKASDEFKELAKKASNPDEEEEPQEPAEEAADEI